MEIGLQKAKVAKILQRGLVTKLKVDTDKGQREALYYSRLLGEVEVGQEVVINTTAVDLGLGSGGFDFVVVNLDNLPLELKGQGHIIKLRYTPLQLKVLAEEEISELPLTIHNPVILAELHSMLVPAAFGVWSVNPSLKIGYIMTDGGALPIDYSLAVLKLQKSGHDFLTYTAGHSFGGEKEAVNIYSALALASQECDIIIMGMGPGIVGTNSLWGTTALEVGTGINAVNSLGGRAIVIPRIMTSDKRKRHWGLSHHTITSLKRIALGLAEVVFTNSKWLTIDLEPHRIVIEKYPCLDYAALSLSTMGRSYSEESEFFQTAAATGAYAAKVCLN